MDTSGALEPATTQALNTQRPRYLHPSSSLLWAACSSILRTIPYVRATRWKRAT